MKHRSISCRQMYKENLFRDKDELVKSIANNVHTYLIMVTSTKTKVDINPEGFVLPHYARRPDLRVG